MAWQADTGKHQYRKEASAAQRSEVEREAVIEPTTSHRRKSMPGYKRKYGIEERYVGSENPYGGLSFLFPAKIREWHHSIGAWYEKERDRDQAISAMRKQRWRSGRYEFRPVDR